MPERELLLGHLRARGPENSLGPATAEPSASRLSGCRRGSEPPHRAAPDPGIPPEIAHENGGGAPADFGVPGRDPRSPREFLEGKGPQAGTFSAWGPHF